MQQSANSLSAKAAVVTGGAGGIGLEAAVKLAERGARVVIADLPGPRGEQAAAKIVEGGGVAHFVEADLTSMSEVERLTERALSLYGAIDIAVNNAGIPGPYKGILDLTEEEWNRTLAINLSSVFFCMKHQIKAMLDRGGSIVNIGSAGILRPTSPQPDYQASKAGLLALTRNAAVMYGPNNIRINAVLPGSTLTPMLEERLNDSGISRDMLNARIPLNRIGTAEEIANAILWLSSDESSFVTGSAVVVDGGFQLL